MKKKFFAGFLMALAFILCMIGLTGCGDTGRGQTSGETVETLASADKTSASSVETSAAASELSASETEILDPVSETSDPEIELFDSNTETIAASGEVSLPDEDGSYTSKDDVALYLHVYGKLPGNFITKTEARELGWEGGELEPYAPGKSIGGDRFGNYEGLLPEEDGRIYYECDIDTQGKKRGAKRIVYSSDGLIYYTEDHYETFTLLYGKQ